MTSTIEQKKGRLFIVLSGIFITNALLAEMVGVKIFSAESTVGLTPARLMILGFEMSFNLTAGALLWPVVFITSELLIEYCGTPGVRLLSYFTSLLIAYAFLAIFLPMQLAPADFWLETNKTDTAGNPFNIQYAYTKIFG